MPPLDAPRPPRVSLPGRGMKGGPMTESSQAHGASSSGVTEAEATRLAWQAVELAGGARMIYGNPRQPFSPNARKVFEVDGQPSRCAGAKSARRRSSPPRATSSRSTTKGSSFSSALPDPDRRNSPRDRQRRSSVDPAAPRCRRDGCDGARPAPASPGSDGGFPRPASPAWPPRPGPPPPPPPELRRRFPVEESCASGAAGRR